MVGQNATREEISDAADALLGKTAREISGNIDHRAEPDRDKSKQALSQLIETDYFGIPQNTRSEPDFTDAGIELKVTPLIPTGNGTLLRPKERLKIGSLNYSDAYEADHWTEVDLLRHKLDDVLIIWYVFQEGVPRSEYRVVWWTFWSPSDEQSRRMQRDFKRTRKVIAEGHELATELCEFLGTFSDNRGGFNKENPRQSKQGSITNSHPTREVAQIRGWCIKSRSMKEVLEDATNQKRMSRHGATGISRSRLEKQMEERASGDVDNYRIQKTLGDFVNSNK